MVTKIYGTVGDQVFLVWTSETSDVSEVPQDERTLCVRSEIVDAIDEFLARHAAALVG